MPPSSQSEKTIDKVSLITADLAILPGLLVFDVLNEPNKHFLAVTINL